jgi:hypothetical protein
MRYRGADVAESDTSTRLRRIFKGRGTSRRGPVPAMLSARDVVGVWPFIHGNTWVQVEREAGMIRPAGWE